MYNSAVYYGHVVTQNDVSSTNLKPRRHFVHTFASKGEQVSQLLSHGKHYAFCRTPKSGGNVTKTDVSFGHSALHWC